MPRPVSGTHAYLPGLDGLRAVAVVAVILYHLEIPWMSGGLLGVGMFFTLSGYLITTILLRTWERTGGAEGSGRRGHLDLRTFWLRRARRLLPAVILLLVVVLVATALVAPTDLPRRAWESVAAMLYVSNWTMIAADTSYFDAFNGPGALDHLWSLAVEEQFYLVWPLLLLGLLKALRGRLRQVAVAILVLATLSFVLMAVVAQPGFDNTRAYEGTDTRAGGLLVGAALAMVWRSDRLSAAIGPPARLLLDGTGVVALAVIGWLFVTTDPFALSLYSGGILALSVATATLVGVVVHPASRVADAFSRPLLVWIGERSYGIYLWHLPIVVFTPDTVLADAPVVRGVVQVGLTLLLAALSWTVVEDPIRRHGLRASLRPARRTTGDRGPGVPALVRGTGVLVGIGTLCLAVLPVVGGTAREPRAAAAPLPAASTGSPSPTDPDTVTEVPAAPSPTGPPRNTDVASEASKPHQSERSEPSASPTPAGPPETSCDEVVHIGDSTSRGLFNPDQLPEPETRLDARYRAVGAETVIDEVFPAMSVVETYQDEPNADERVAMLVDDGYHGCWVFALGLQDAANQSVGGVVELPDRIDRLMEQVGDMPALWSTGYAIEQDGPWSDPELQKWNEAVVEACDRWPNMRVWDWRSQAQDQWYDQDGIHFNPEGDVVRAQGFAAALATAFPADGDRPVGCLVTTPGPTS